MKDTYRRAREVLSETDCLAELMRLRFGGSLPPCPACGRTGGFAGSLNGALAACSLPSTTGRTVYAVGFDNLVPGNRSPTVNHLRLWSGRAVVPFNVTEFNAGKYAPAVGDEVTLDIAIEAVRN